MPEVSNRAALERARENWNRGDLDSYLEIYDPDVVLHGYPPGLPAGVQGARLFYQGLWSAFPNPHLVFEDVVAEGERVAVRYLLRATHRGDFMGVPPTDKEVTITGITILRFAGGKCVERWNQADMLGLLQQLGAVPTPGQ